MSTGHKMRIYHRYLGFFLAGIMAVYALSGIVLIFRDKGIFTKEVQNKITLKTNPPIEKLGEALEMRRFKVEKVEGDLVYFKNGTYNSKTLTAEFTTDELPYILDKMTGLHKANSSEPLAFLNIFFGVSLLFFVLSAFWMYTPKSSIFKKGMYFTLGGLILALALLFI